VPDRIRIATQNVWGRRGDWDARRPALIEGLRRLEPDLVAMPEAIVTDSYDEVRDLLGPDFHVAHQAQREWTARQALDGMSVCYRDAWESVHPHEGGHTFTPENPIMVGGDWPFRRIDYVLVRCGEHEGPTLPIDDCRLIFDQPVDGVWASDHFGVCVDLAAPPTA
jgi:endonuclease/exonuclease/phosphatase family metal-dependent hydrolase